MKRGFSHIEIVFAFGIFIGVVVFVFYFLNPITKSKKEISESHLVYLKNNFFQMASTNVTIIFLNSSQPCSPIILTNGTYEDLGQNKYYIFLSDEIISNLNSCESLGINFNVGSIRKKKILSNASLERIKETYYNNYKELLKNLSMDSSFNFEVLSEGYELKKNFSSEKTIISMVFRSDVIYSNGTIEKKDFTFKIW